MPHDPRAMNQQQMFDPRQQPGTHDPRQQVQMAELFLLFSDYRPADLTNLFAIYLYVLQSDFQAVLVIFDLNMGKGDLVVFAMPLSQHTTLAP